MENGHQGSGMTVGDVQAGTSPCVAAPRPWMLFSAARVAARATNSPCGGIPSLPLPTASLTSGSGRLLPRFLRKKPKAGGRKRLTTGGTGRDGRTGQTDASAGLGSRWDLGPCALSGWGAPGPSSASSCGCGCRALPRSLTPTAGTSAGMCHGDPHSGPSISWGLPAAPGGHCPPILPWTEVCSLALCGCRGWGDAGERGWGVHGHLGHQDSFLELFLTCSQRTGQRGDVRVLAKLSSHIRWEI